MSAGIGVQVIADCIVEQHRDIPRSGTGGMHLVIDSRDGAVIFHVRVQPRASRDEIAGVMDGALKVRLQAPALEDRANTRAVRIPRRAFENPEVRC